MEDRRRKKWLERRVRNKNGGHETVTHQSLVGHGTPVTTVHGHAVETGKK